MQTHDSDDQRPHSKRAMWLVIIALVCGTGVGLAYLSRERRQLSDLAAANQNLNAALDRTQVQLRTLAERLNERAAAVAVRPRPVAASVRTGAAPSRTTSRAALDPRVNQIQNQLAEQQKQIDSSRDDLNKTRDDLESKVNSTHDE